MKFYSFNIKLWQDEAGYLPLELQAIYLRLVNYYHDTESPIPKDYSKIIARLGLSDHQESVNKIISDYFVLTDEGYRHDQYDSNIEKYHAQIERNKNNGSKGGRPKRPDYKSPNGEY